MHMDKTMLEKITLIVPSYNRQDYLLEVIKYWANSDVRLCIADGTATPLPDAVVKEIPKNIRYFSLPEASIEDRVIYAGRQADTDYVLYMGDDEYYSEQALMVCINVLEFDREINFCGGMSVGFKADDGRLVFKSAYSEQLAHNSLSDCPRKRMIQALSLYTSNASTAVGRRNAWLLAVECALLGAGTARYLNEIIFELASACLGKTLRLPVAFWYRNYSSSPIRETYPDRTDGGCVSLQFVEWWKNSKYIEENKKLLESLASVLSLRISIPEFSIRHALEKAFDGFYQWQGGSIDGKEHIFKPSFFPYGKEKSSFEYAQSIKVDDEKKAAHKSLIELDQLDWAGSTSLHEYLTDHAFISNTEESLKIEHYLTELCLLSEKS